MKYEEALILSEGKFSKALGAAALGLGLLSGGKANAQTYASPNEIVKQMENMEVPKLSKQELEKQVLKLYRNCNDEFRMKVDEITNGDTPSVELIKSQAKKYKDKNEDANLIYKFIMVRG